MGLPASGEGVCDRHSLRKMRVGELSGRRHAEKGGEELDGLVARLDGDESFSLMQTWRFGVG